MSFAVPSNGYRLEGASLRNSYQAGRDFSGSITSLEVRVTDQQRQITELSSQLAELLLREAQSNMLAARLAAVEQWALKLSAAI